jgi:hypothetical protein
MKQTMKRNLVFDEGIISGDKIREIQSVFPETSNTFRQRKSFDEYYWDETTVEIDLIKIQKLNGLWIEVSLTEEEIKVKW